jgi:3-polyprenyl-4-hydroxybenzoate decarboxylase
VQVLHLVTPGVKTEMLKQTEVGYGEHFDTASWDQVTPEEWAAKMVKGIRDDSTVVWPGGKTRLATIAARGPSRLLDRAASRMFKR